MNFIYLYLYICVYVYVYMGAYTSVYMSNIVTKMPMRAYNFNQRDKFTVKISIQVKVLPKCIHYSGNFKALLA